MPFADSELRSLEGEFRSVLAADGREMAEWYGHFEESALHLDGSLLIVVGDVSGKGLKAAMTVSAIVGALRGSTVRTPAKVLSYLSSALYGQVSGFFTCCAALIESAGKVTIANAGHLPPYLNGEELAVAHGLPLGIADETLTRSRPGSWARASALLLFPMEW